MRRQRSLTRCSRSVILLQLAIRDIEPSAFTAATQPHSHGGAVSTRSSRSAAHHALARLRPVSFAARSFTSTATKIVQRCPGLVQT